MKKIKNIAVLFAMGAAVLLSSCSKEYLDRTPTTALDTDLVLNSTDMLPSTVVGTMRMMYSSSFGGKYATIVGDIMTDMVSSVRGSNGSFRELEEWNLNQSTPDVSTLWAAGYQIAASSARTIHYAKRKLSTDSANMTVSQKNNLKSAIAASLVIKVYVEYFLSQYFCVDVNVDQNDYKLNSGSPYRVPGNNPGNKVGLILLRDGALSLTDPANMSTLAATYQFMEEEIAEAIAYFEASGSNSFTLAAETRFYPTLCAAYMTQARVYLAQHKYDLAYAAAENALNNLPSGTSKTLISKQKDLINAYGENLSSEDIWTLNYTAQDNLSANSLQNLFGSYGFNPSETALSLFRVKNSCSDIRRGLYFGKSERPTEPNTTSFCWKYPNANGIFNVPILRIPEIYLVQAEARAALGNTTEAKELLFQVLGARDTAIDNIADMETRYDISDETIMKVILDENAREFLCEGHRWSDLRRNGMRLTREGNSDDQKFPTHFTNYPLSSFALPVPYSETSTEQWKNGRGWFDNGTQDIRNWQNNAWDERQGDSYSNTATLPIDGEDYKTSDN